MALVYLVQHHEKVAEPGDRPLSALSLDALCGGPLRRAWQTSEGIAGATGLEIRCDNRLRERMNWDFTRPIGEFLDDWGRSTRDRDSVPRGGDPWRHHSRSASQPPRRRRRHDGAPHRWRSAWRHHHP
jgi:hypothetical protein